MKSYYFVVVCVCISQVYSGAILEKYFRTPSFWTQLDDQQLEGYYTRLTLIHDIHPQTLSDVETVLREFRQNFAVVKFFGEVNEVLGKDLHGNDATINATEAEQFLNRAKEEKQTYKTNDTVDMINEIGQTISEKLPTDQVNRVMTLVRILEGTPTSISNGLRYLYDGIVSETASNFPATTSSLITAESPQKKCVKECVDRCF